MASVNRPAVVRTCLAPGPPPSAGPRERWPGWRRYSSGLEGVWRCLHSGSSAPWVRRGRGVTWNECWPCPGAWRVGAAPGGGGSLGLHPIPALASPVPLGALGVMWVQQRRLALPFGRSEACSAHLGLPGTCRAWGLNPRGRGRPQVAPMLSLMGSLALWGSLVLAAQAAGLDIGALAVRRLCRGDWLGMAGRGECVSCGGLWRALVHAGLPALCSSGRRGPIQAALLQASAHPPPPCPASPLF